MDPVRVTRDADGECQWYDVKDHIHREGLANQFH